MLDKNKIEFDESEGENLVGSYPLQVWGALVLAVLVLAGLTGNIDYENFFSPRETPAEVSNQN